MSLELRIEHASGETTALSAEQGASRTRDLDEQGRAEAIVYRDDWAEADVDDRNDELYLDVNGAEEFGGRLDKESAGEGTVTVTIASFETDAADAEPTGANLVYQNTADSTIVGDAIQSVSGLQAGTLETQASALSYSASHASQSKVIRDQREATGSEIRYNADKTIDYVDRLGSDLSGSVTVGPAESNLGGQFRKTVDVREEVTHVRALGAQDGPNQVIATGVADSYDGGRPVWRRYSNKEIIDESRLQEIADTRVAEYDGEPRALEVECDIYDEALQLGDTVFVDYPEEDVQRPLRIVSITTEWKNRGQRQSVTLSSRSVVRESHTDAKRFDDLQTFNRGYQGFVDRDQVTSGWNVAGDGTPQTLQIVNWPDDIVEEKTVQLAVQGRAWRSPVDAGGHNHSFSIGSHVHSVDIPGHVHDVDVTYPDHRHPVLVDQTTTGQTEGHFHDYWEAESNTGLGSSSETNTITSQDDGGTTETTSDGGGTSTTTSSSTPLNAVVTTSFGGTEYYPSDVEIRVDGSIVDTIAGDSQGSWTETVDLRTELSSGMNLIEATPTSSRGSVNLSLASELFRRGPTSQ